MDDDSATNLLDAIKSLSRNWRRQTAAQQNRERKNSGSAITRR